MIVAKRPHDEVKRLAALRSYALLDTDPEPVFDTLTGLAATMAATPIALMSLVDSDRQWFKSAHGLGISETPRELAFCAHAILQETPLIVEDASEDKRFGGNPLVTGAQNIQFYAGIQLRASSGHRLGTLCVIDQVPRRLRQDRQTALAILGRHVETQMMLRRATDLSRVTATSMRSQPGVRGPLDSPAECPDELPADIREPS